MILVSLCSILGGASITVFAYEVLYYLNNLIIYRDILDGMNLNPVNFNLTSVNKSNFLNETGEFDLNTYIMGYFSTEREKIFGILLNYLIMGIMQVICGICAFNIRRPHYEWTKDIIPYILYESFW